MAKEKILIVDDEEDIRELLEYNLTKEGFGVVQVSSGEEALHVTERDSPDLIILDLMLPGIEGLDVCRTLKQDPGTRQIPIIMLTAKGEEADIVAGLEIGAADYTVEKMLKNCLQSLIDLDADLAHEVIRSDDGVDEMNRAVHTAVVSAIEDAPRSAGVLIHYWSVSRYLERIADLATNIAEDVVYMIKGEIIRHRDSD